VHAFHRSTSEQPPFLRRARVHTRMQTSSHHPNYILLWREVIALACTRCSNILQEPTLHDSQYFQNDCRTGDRSHLQARQGETRQFGQSGINSARHLHSFSAIWLTMSWRNHKSSRRSQQDEQLKCLRRYTVLTLSHQTHRCETATRCPLRPSRPLSSDRS